MLVHGYDLGVAHNGGYAEYARVPGDWVVPLPDGLSTTQAMAIGTAGFTAALAVARLERHGVEPGDGPVLVTGATGGVGSTAVSILAARGYEVVASTGKDAREYLEALGAAEIIGRDDVAGDGKPLGKQRWAAAVDCVGGAVLAGLFPQIRYGGAVAATGLTAGIKVETTVMPFILRSVALLGIDSVQTPMEERAEIWRRLADDLRPPQLDDAIAREISLDEHRAGARRDPEGRPDGPHRRPRRLSAALTSARGRGETRRHVRAAPLLLAAIVCDGAGARDGAGAGAGEAADAVAGLRAPRAPAALAARRAWVMQHWSVRRAALYRCWRRRGDIWPGCATTRVAR